MNSAKHMTKCLMMMWPLSGDWTHISSVVVGDAAGVLGVVVVLLGGRLGGAAQHVHQLLPEALRGSKVASVNAQSE